MSLSLELTNFAHAIRNALAESANQSDADTWIVSVTSHFDAQTPAAFAQPAPSPTEPPAVA